MRSGLAIRMGLVVGVLLLTLLMGCQSTGNGAQMMATEQARITGMLDDTELSGEMVFRVGKKVITGAAYSQKLKEDIGPLIQQFLAQGKTRLEVTEMAESANVRQSVLDRFIQEELLLWLADQEGVDVNSGAIAEEVERQQQGMFATPSPQEIIELRAREARQQRILTMVARNTKTDSFHTRHILFEVQVPVTATQQQRDTAFAQAKTEAEAMLKRLQEGEDFATLAREYSDDHGSSGKGGDLGWVTRGTFVPDFETVALSKTLQLHTPVVARTAYGYHVIEVLDRKFDRPFNSFDELRMANNPGSLIDSSFMPWYDAFEREKEDEGILEINASFDLMRVPLPFPETP